MLSIIAINSLADSIPQMTIMGSRKAPLSNKNDAKIVGQIPFETLHPKYPKGAPQGKGGEFMPKGSSDYKTAVANNLITEVKKGKLTIEQARQAAKNLTQFGSKARVIKKAQNILKDRSATQKQRKNAKQVIVKATKNVVDYNKAFKEYKDALWETKKRKTAYNLHQKHGTFPHTVAPYVEALDKLKDVSQRFQLVRNNGLTVKSNVPVKTLSEKLLAWDKYFTAIYSPVIPSELKDKERDNQWIVKAIIEGHKTGEYNNIAVLDAKNNVQAVLLYDKKIHGNRKSLHVSWLATAPWNIYDPSISKKTLDLLSVRDPSYIKGVKGAGAKAIAQAVKESIKQGYGGALSLTALPRAVPFYKHLGFARTKTGEMLLSKEAAQALLKKYL